jgi:hypothetical protein
VLFPASPALYSGARDKRVEVESGFAALVVSSEERFVKGTSPAVGEVVRRRVDRARSSSDTSHW